ncbi:MAG TPA: hypothetical protein VEB86_12710 [Chryseosolibacter sp.]|nr:hypothetical protein [Chryseosolibacter sp.]
MELHHALITNFNDYLAGREVEATIRLKSDETLTEGQHVIAIKDTIAATTSVTVPAGKVDQVMGVEGTITSIEMRDPVKAGTGIQRVRIKKA